MTHSLKKNSPLLLANFFFYILFFVSVVFTFRFVSSVSVVLMLVCSITINKIETESFYNPNLNNPLLVTCLLFFLWQFAGLIYTGNGHAEWNNIRVKSSLWAVPIALCCSSYPDDPTRRKLLKAYCLILLAASVYCILIGFRNYRSGHNISVLFYHTLVRPIAQHAIQFSILICVAIIHLFENLKSNSVVFKKVMDLLLVVFFTLVLFLLSSKLIIVFCLLYFAYSFFTHLTIKNNRLMFLTTFIACLSAGCVMIFTANPVKQRFSEVLTGDLNLVTQKKFSPGKYFNDVQFRLLQWRFTAEILNDKKAWLFGVSPGDAQSDLNQKYIAANMYTGTPERGDKGFLGYNTHNEFLEALLQSGIIGLVFFLMICFALMRMARKRAKAELNFVIILLLGYAFTESVFESQYSILIFIFFPLFFYVENNATPS